MCPRSAIQVKHRLKEPAFHYPQQTSNQMQIDVYNKKTGECVGLIYLNRGDVMSLDHIKQLMIVGVCPIYRRDPATLWVGLSTKEIPRKFRAMFARPFEEKEQRVIDDGDILFYDLID